MTTLLTERTHIADALRRTPHARLGGVTVIIPCYNERGAIRDTVDQVVRSLRASDRPYEVIVVDDGSTDGSAGALASHTSGEPVRVLQNTRNRGYGYSLKRAVREATFELIVITDADGTYPNRRIAELVDLMGDADMVVGARTGASVKVPLIRRPAKWFLRKLASYLASYDIPDLNSGLRVMKRSLIMRFMPLLPDGFSFTTTITLALLTHGFDVRYVPIDYAKRIGRSSIRPIRDTLNFLSLIVRTVMYFKPLKVFAPVSAALFVSAAGAAIGSKLLMGQLADVTSVTLALSSVQLLAIGLLADLIDKRSPSYTA